MSILAIGVIIFSALSLLSPSWSWTDRLASSLSQKYQNQNDNQLISPHAKVDVSYTKTPSKKPGATPLQVAATAGLIIDAKTNTVLFEKQSDQSLPMASLTKIATALVIMNHHKSEEIVTIPDLPAETVAASQTAALKAGERYKLADALKIMLVYSANDMANALAIWDAGSIEKFVDKMNNEVAYWHLNKTKFANPTGLDSDGHRASSRDLARLTRILLQSNLFTEIVQSDSTNVSSLQGKLVDLPTTNKLLLSRSDVFGVKTGFDSAAGQCLITLSRRDGNEVITVILNSPDRFAESQNMIEWAFASYTWQ